MPALPYHPMPSSTLSSYVFFCTIVLCPFYHIILCPVLPYRRMAFLQHSVVMLCTAVSYHPMSTSALHPVHTLLVLRFPYHPRHPLSYDHMYCYRYRAMSSTDVQYGATRAAADP
eukprot:1089657-Rhodomonas_salina.1